MEQLVESIKKWINQTDRRMIIGISGHGAAGKSTFTKQLVELLKPNKVNVLETDPYIIDSEVRQKTMLTYFYGNQEHTYKMTACHPSAHHLPSLERDVLMLKRGLGLYTIDTHYSKSEWMDPENRITIVEGMSVAFLKPQLFDLTVYFYTDEEMEFQRRSIRDINERGTKLDYLRHSHQERRIQYEIFMHPYHKEFDIVVKNSTEIIGIPPVFNNV